MLYVPAYTHERRPYSATLYPTSFTLDSLLALTICTQRKTYGLCFTSGLMACGSFLCDCTFWDDRGGGLTRQPMGPLGHSNHHNINERKSRGLGKFQPKMLCVPAYTYERRPYSATMYPSRFILDSSLALTIRALLKTHGLCFIPGLMAYGGVSCNCMFWDDREGGLTGQPVSPQVDTTTITTVMYTNRVDSGGFSSRCSAFRRKHTSADPIRLLCTRLTLSLPSRFSPSARLVVVFHNVPYGWLAEAFSCDCMFWNETGGGLTRQPVGPLVGTATMTAVMSANRMDSGSFSSRCCAFRRTHTSANPIRLLCTRLALPLALSLPSRFAPSERLTVGVSPRTLWLAGIFLSRNKMSWCSRDTHRLGAERGGGHNDDTTAGVRCVV